MRSRSFPLGAAIGAMAALGTAQPAAAARLVPLAASSAALPVSFKVKLPLRDRAELESLVAAQSDPRSPMYHHFLTPAQFRASFSPTPAAMARAAALLRGQGFTVASLGSQLLVASGSAASVSSAFHTRLGAYRASDGRTRIAAASRLTPTPALAQLGASVIGLATTIRPRPLAVRAAPQNRYSQIGGYWFDDLKQAYAYPSYGVANGTGVTIATVGVADFSSSDANLYFTHEKLGPGGLAPQPKIQHLIMPGGAPFSASSDASFEADLDVTQAGGSAPGATVVGIDVDGSLDEPFLSAYSYLDETNVADVVSTSYGECELYYTAAYNNGVDETSILQAYHDLFVQGNAQGITFAFSSGDGSDRDCFPLGYFDGGPGATYAAMSGAGIWVDDPNATGVGGTNLLTTAPATAGKPSDPSVPPLPSKYVSENAIVDRVVTPYDPYGEGNNLTGLLWGSGNGTSVIFPKPQFQAGVTPAGGRVVPDVSMHMGGCPFYGATVVVDCHTATDSYDLVYLGGALYGAIGTSASSPEFAGALAVLESLSHQRFGNVNPLLYSLAAKNASGGYFHQGIPAQDAELTIPAGTPGYSPIVGNGTPIVSNIAKLYAPIPALAGNPQTASNP